MSMPRKRFPKILRAILGVSIGLHLAGSASAWGQEYVNAQLPWQKPVLDQRGRLLAWYQPDKNRGYDKVMRLAWDFIEHKVPNDTRHHTGLKIYLINSVFDDHTLQGYNWQGNPASLFGQFVDSVVGWYPYSGDDEAVRFVREMLDYQLAHGTTPGDWDWPLVPFATNCDDESEYGRCLRDTPREFYGGIETDKVGELGIGYALFYEMAGDRKYLGGALHCAEALARHVRTGDEDHTPWPFRVDARTGQVIFAEDYGGMIVAPIRLFDELIRIGAGDTASFQKARDTAWKWIRDNPLNGGSAARDKWSGYFEDVPKHLENVNQASPTMTAYYILTREDPAAADGIISCCGQGCTGEYWFDDGYGDYIRNFMWALGAIPEFAPVSESHLLRSTSVVQKVNYDRGSISYRTFDKAANEVLRVNFKPARVTSGGAALTERRDLREVGYTVQALSGGDYVVRVRHANSGEVTVLGR